MNKAVTNNVLWNWGGMGVSMLAGFVVAPFLVHRLGETVYGLWILIASLTGYFGLLDLGVRGSVGRYIAYHRATEDHEGINSILNTALAILLGVAGIALLATVLAILVFFHLFDVPVEEAGSTRMALLIVGINLAVTFPVTVFDGTLWGFQRFDLLNAVDIPTTLARTGLTFWFVGQGYGLVALAVITFASTAASAVVKGVISFRINRSMRLGWGYVKKNSAGQLFGYGIWHFMLSVSRQINGQLGPLLIGSILSVALVTPFSIAARLLGYAGQFVVACTGVLTPVATTLHAQERHEDQRRLFVTGGKYCLAISLFMGMGFLLLGRPLIGLWMGPKLAGASVLLSIMAAGEILPMSQWLTYSMILGMAKHRLSAWVGFVEAVLVVGLAVGLVRPYGLVGVCLAFAVAGVLCRGVFQVVYGCKLVGMGVGEYVMQVMMWPTIAAIGVGAGAWAGVSWRMPKSWGELFLYGGIYAAVYGMVMLWVLGAWGRVWGYGWARVKKKGSGVRGQGSEKRMEPQMNTDTHG